MDGGRIALAGIGSLAALAGLFVLTRHAADEAARYRRRIAGTMLMVFGGATVLLTVLLTRAQSLEALP